MCLTRTSQSTSALAEQEPFPWLYPYREDPQQTRLGQPILRPFVQVSLANGGESTTILDGLIDTGADAILASDLLADLLGIDLADHEGETQHAIGSRTHLARYKTIALRLHPHDGEIGEYREGRPRSASSRTGTATASSFLAALASLTALPPRRADSRKPSLSRSEGPSMIASALSRSPEWPRLPAERPGGSDRRAAQRGWQRARRPEPAGVFGLAA